MALAVPLPSTTLRRGLISQEWKSRNWSWAWRARRNWPTVLWTAFSSLQFGAILKTAPTRLSSFMFSIRQVLPRVCWLLLCL